MRKLRIAQFLMAATILLIVAFQCYWITRLYGDEWKDLKKETDVLFRETVYRLQVNRFKKDTMIFRRISGENLFGYDAVNVVRRLKADSSSAIKGRRTRIAYALPVENELHDMNDPLFNLPPDAFIDSISSGKSGKAFEIKVVTTKRGMNESTPTIGIDSLVKFEFPERPAQSSVPSTEPAMITIGKRVGGSPYSALSKEQHRRNEKVVAKKVKATGKREETTEIKTLTRDTLLNDSLPVEQIDSAFAKDLAKAGINVRYQVKKGFAETKEKARPAEDELATNPVSVGIFGRYYYNAVFENPSSFIVRKITPQIIASFLLIGFTVLSFVVLYKNLMNQRRLADIKNEFISNITHELKTPIATVNVAVEAMRSFNALQDPARTKEYLEISAGELQRLSLLVDKVLRLSMFEKKEIEVKKEWFNLPELVMEVISNMKLQLEKYTARVNLNITGDNTDVQADRLHITSVVYNLFDNALKYGSITPVIDVDIKDEGDKVYLSVSDNGIGIQPEYHGKIFEKFFRVPANDTHNIKGYGLGLSYVGHIIKQHNGTIEVESEVGKGSRFIIQLPK